MEGVGEAEEEGEGLSVPGSIELAESSPYLTAGVVGEEEDQSLAQTVNTETERSQTELAETNYLELEI